MRKRKNNPMRAANYLLLGLFLIAAFVVIVLNPLWSKFIRLRKERKMKYLSRIFFAMAFLALMVGGIPLLYKATHPVTAVATMPEPAEFSNLEAKINIGNDWIGTCPDGSSWMIRLQASDSDSVLLLEGNPNVELTAVTHKAPGAFFSNCMFIRVIPSGFGEGDWKVKIYSQP